MPYYPFSTDPLAESQVTPQKTAGFSYPTVPRMTGIRLGDSTGQEPELLHCEKGLCIRIRSMPSSVGTRLTLTPWSHYLVPKTYQTLLQFLETLIRNSFRAHLYLSFWFSWSTFYFSPSLSLFSCTVVKSFQHHSLHSPLHEFASSSKIVWRFRASTLWFSLHWLNTQLSTKAETEKDLQPVSAFSDCKFHLKLFCWLYFFLHLLPSLTWVSWRVSKNSRGVLLWLTISLLFSSPREFPVKLSSNYFIGRCRAMCVILWWCCSQFVSMAVAVNVWGGEIPNQYWQRKPNPVISEVSGETPIDLLFLLLLQMCKEMSNGDVGASVPRAEKSHNKKLMIHRDEVGKIRFWLSLLKTLSIIYLCTTRLILFQIPSSEGLRSGPWSDLPRCPLRPQGWRWMGEVCLSAATCCQPTCWPWTACVLEHTTACAWRWWAANKSTTKGG